MEADGVIRRNPQLVSRELAGEGGAVLLHLESGAYHGLNETGILADLRARDLIAS